MSKKSIGNQYDIEYTHPAILAKTSRRSWIGRLFFIAIISIALLVISMYYDNGRISNYLQELVTNYTSDEKTDSYDDFNKNNQALPIITTDIEETDEQNVAEEVVSDNLQDINTNKVAVTKPNSSQSFDSTSKKHPAEEAPPSGITNNTATNTKKATENEAIIESLAKLDDLAKQLSAEREKNKKLENKLKKNQSSSDDLSKLLANSLNKNKDANNNDKQYLSALEDLNEAKPIKKASNKQATNNTLSNKKSDNIAKKDKDILEQQKINSESKMTTAVEATEEVKKELNDANNTVSLSTMAQVDAIILAMQQANNKTTKIAKVNKKTTPDVNTETTSENTGFQNDNNDLISQLSQHIGENSDLANTRTDDLMAVGTENKLNRLIATRNSNSNYERALNQESMARSNAVRSIVVKKGETLWSIAKRAYGDGKYYKKILTANPQIRRNKTVRLVVGQVIRVPK